MNNINSEQFTEEQLRLLQKIAEYSVAYGWMLHRTSEYYSALYKKLSFGAITLNIISSSLIFSILINDITVIKGVSGIITVVSALLSVANTYFKYQALAEKNQQLAKKFRNTDMEIQIILAKTEKGDPDILLQKYRTIYASLEDDCPEIPPWIQRQFEIQHPNVHVPAKVGGVGTIRIHSNSVHGGGGGGGGEEGTTRRPSLNVMTPRRKPLTDVREIRGQSTTIVEGKEGMPEITINL